MHTPAPPNTTETNHLVSSEISPQMSFHVYGHVLPNLAMCNASIRLQGLEKAKITTTSRFLRLTIDGKSFNVAEYPFTCDAYSLSVDGGLDAGERVKLRLVKDWREKQNVDFHANLELEPVEILKANMLNREKECTVTDIQCKACRQSLQTRRFSKAIDLPSPYWYELFDAWICHEDQQLQFEKRLGFSHQDAHQAGKEQPKDRLLVGGGGGSLIKFHKCQLQNHVRFLKDVYRRLRHARAPVAFQVDTKHPRFQFLTRT